MFIHLFWWNFCTWRELLVLLYLLFPSAFALEGHFIHSHSNGSWSANGTLWRCFRASAIYWWFQTAAFSLWLWILFEKAPPVSAHPLQQPERIRQRTHFVISAYRVSKDDTKTTLFHTKILLRCPEYRKWLVFWITVILNWFSSHFLKLLCVFVL